MDTNVETVSFVTAAVALFATVLGVGWKAIAASKGLDEFRERFARLEVKANALWDIYGLDAIREARMGGLTARHSDEAPTEKFFSMVPSDVRGNIEKMILTRHQHLAAGDLTLEVWMTFKDCLAQVADDHDVSVRGMYGVVSVMCSAPYKSNNSK